MCAGFEEGWNGGDLLTKLVFFPWSRAININCTINGLFGLVHVHMQWSFGVVLWELMTLGKTPYEEIEPEDMLAQLTKGHRLTQPKNCPDDL